MEQYLLLTCMLFVVLFIVSVYFVINNRSSATLDNPTLSIILDGGLGNQVWQMAAATYIAKQTNRQLVFHDTRSPITNHTSTNYFKTILSPWKNTTSRQKSKPIIVKEPEEFTYTDDWTTRLSKLPDVKLEGCFQHYLYVTSDFIETLVLPPQPPVAPTMAFIHVRAGDYLGNPKFDIGINTKSTYYTDAVNLFPKDTNFILFTNDDNYAVSLPWVVTLRDRVALAEKRWSELDCMSVMASCPLGGICANSTFAWWGARIGYERDDTRKYVFPYPWFTWTKSEALYFPGSIKLAI